MRENRSSELFISLRVARGAGPLFYTVEWHNRRLYTVIYYYYYAATREQSVTNNNNSEKPIVLIPTLGVIECLRTGSIITVTDSLLHHHRLIHGLLFYFPSLPFSTLYTFFVCTLHKAFFIVFFFCYFVVAVKEPFCYTLLLNRVRRPSMPPRIPQIRHETAPEMDK